MSIVKIGKKFPWYIIPLIIVVIILSAVVLGLLVPDFATWMLGGLAAIGIFLWDMFIGCITSMYFWAGFGIMGIIFFIYYYRKNYAKKKVLVTTPTTVGTGYDSLSKPLFDDDTKVESA